MPNNNGDLKCGEVLYEYHTIIVAFLQSALEKQDSGILRSLKTFQCIASRSVQKFNLHVCAACLCQFSKKCACMYETLLCSTGSHTPAHLFSPSAVTENSISK